MEDNFDVFQTMTTVPCTFPCKEIVDVKVRHCNQTPFRRPSPTWPRTEEKTKGNKINIEQLANEHHLVLITMKSIPCPVCPQLLRILNMYGLDPDVNRYVDPFTQQEWTIDPERKKFFRLLLQKDAYFIVMCPGSRAGVADIQKNTPFLDYPFIGGEQAMELGRALKLNMSDDELWPAMLQICRGTLAVEKIYIGRGPGHYFHRFLLERLIDERCKWEMMGVVAYHDAYNLIDQLKRKIQKCKDRKLASWILSFSATDILPKTDLPAPSSSSEFPAQDLPPEILDIVLSFAPDIASLVKVARTSRVFYITVCNILVARLRHHMEALRPALPHVNGDIVSDETEVVNCDLDRWAASDAGIGCRELQRRVQSLKEVESDIAKWTKRWTPRRPKPSSAKPPMQNIQLRMGAM
ncbi:uncharacterized protein BYT42DRAFT_202243 [Radiomyces spectabilis]|uniref:uncharacterized protein n=1 Tax=Radiomyces spectabilis TaxID=64574 RepID=UPI00221F4438|nr:uncharacterized protein BYT42DRAFT_202243 [Radiomyces spectabilis]KAI8391628.1 hypothetical protein BYT42DRAFT_202243 [Radiomyces spectabilis]